MSKTCNQLTKNILLSIAMLGVVAISATSPFFLLNLTRVIARNKKYFKKIFEKDFDEKEIERKISKTFYRLKEKKLIVINKTKTRIELELTKKGKNKIVEIQTEQITLKKPEKWDGKWRVVIFDIPEKHKKSRDILREKLKELNFYQLQKSVWTCPYPCEEVIWALCEIFEIVPFVDILITEKIYNDAEIKKHFKV